MQIKIYIPLVLFCAVVILLVKPERSHSSPNRVVKLGVITDLSGVGAYWGKKSQLGIEMAQEELGSEPIKFQIIFGDHGLKPSSAATEAQKMVNSDKVDMLWVEFATAAVAASSIARQAKLPFLNVSGAASILANNPYAFKTFLDYARGCREIAQRWKKQGVLKVGIVKLNAEFADQCLQGAQEVYPKLKVAAYNFNEDFSTQVLGMKTAGVEAIFNVGFEEHMLQLLKKLEELHYSPLIGVAAPDSVTPQVVKTYPNFLKKVVSFGFPPIEKAFIEKVQKRVGTNNLQSIEATAMSYIHTKQIYTALSSCPDADTECVLKKLAASPPDSTMAFVGWKERVADFGFEIKDWGVN